MEPFRLSSVYGFLLSALIASSLVTPALLGLFMKQPQDLGYHGAAWMNWLCVACLYVGIQNGAAASPRWNAAAKRHTAVATAVVYGAWSLQNVLLCMSDRFRPLMWMHAAGCLTCALLSARYAAKLRVESAAPAASP